jgi:hypothetical protein
VTLWLGLMAKKMFGLTSMLSMTTLETSLAPFKKEIIRSFLGINSGAYRC